MTVFPSLDLPWISMEFHLKNSVEYWDGFYTAKSIPHTEGWKSIQNRGIPSQYSTDFTEGWNSVPILHGIPSQYSTEFTEGWNSIHNQGSTLAGARCPEALKNFHGYPENMYFK